MSERSWMKAVLFAVVSIVLIAPSANAQSYADLYGAGGNFGPGQNISLGWAASTESCSSPDWYDAEVSGSDGYYMYDSNGSGYGDFSPSDTAPTQPIEVDYYLDVSMGGVLCADTYTADASGAIYPAPSTPSYLADLSQGYITPNTPCGFAGCIRNYSGFVPWQFNRTYQVIDQWGNGTAAYMEESINFHDSSCGSTNWSPGNGNTDSAGRFTDNFSICTETACNNTPCDLYGDQAWDAAGTPVGYYSLHYTNSGFSISP
jgi:hypothetical protein